MSKFSKKVEEIVKTLKEFFKSLNKSRQFLLIWFLILSIFNLVFGNSVFAVIGILFIYLIVSDSIQEDLNRNIVDALNEISESQLDSTKYTLNLLKILFAKTKRLEERVNELEAIIENNKHKSNNDADIVSNELHKDDFSRK
ncbi:hypothetical protein UT300003_32710 [Clostridium sardiniense]